MTVDQREQTPATEQREAVTPETVRRAFGTISGKWKLEIMWALYQRVLRFGELKREIPGITQHMLTTRLRELESDGLITRKVYAEVPPRVEYSLASPALTLAPVIEGLIAWWGTLERDPAVKGTKASR